MVSIPHRLHTNDSGIIAAIKNHLRFQYLIGYIQTFYFLLYFRGLSLFQYLIGYIQTLSSSHPLILSSKVSIPHRLHTNKPFEPLPILTGSEFQYLIGYIQTLESLTEVYEPVMFQYLIGYIQTQSTDIVRIFNRACFNTS